MDEVVTEDFTRNGPDTIYGRGALHGYIKNTRSMFPDLHVSIDTLTTENGLVILEWRFTGTFKGNAKRPGTGKSGTLKGTSALKLVNGKIKSEYATWDDAAWDRQLGTEIGRSNSKAYATLVRTMLEEIYNKGNVAAVDKFTTSNFVGYSMASGERVGPAGVKDKVTAIRTAFPDVYLTVKDMVIDGNKIVCAWRARGTHKGDYLGIAATNNMVNVGGLTMYRIVDGKIAESWESWDRAELLRQLGVTLMPTSAAQEIPKKSGY